MDEIEDAGDSQFLDDETYLDSAKSIAHQKLTFEDKENQEKVYRKQLVEDLLGQQFEFRSGPYEAHIQFSNFCNMSCIMCWDGRNPPAEKSPPELLKLIEEQIAPHLSVITPYSGSEPLTWSWNETREMAEKNSILLCITTNGQFLDEKKFFELKDITETLLVSIDSHIPQVFNMIRPGGNANKVFENLESLGKLCRDHGVECIINIVFMTLNGPHLPETIDYLAELGFETVNIIQLLDVNSRSRHLDPLLHFSKEYVAWIKDRCIRTVTEKRMRLIWSVAGCFEYDFRPGIRVPPLPRKVWNDECDEHMRRMFPGFCRNVFNRLRVDGKGDIAPCCYAIEGELSLGNLYEKPFEAIWNGPSAQDLRRGMLCGDVPSHCSSCRYIDPIGPESDLELTEFMDECLTAKFCNRKIAQDLMRVGPLHASRHSVPPEIKFVTPVEEVREYRLATSMAGQKENIIEVIFDDNRKEANGICSLQIPKSSWEQFGTNRGYWWNVWSIPRDAKAPIRRFRTSAAIIRHEPLKRIEGSELNYPSDGALPVIDLGTSKQLGWNTIDSIPDRPRVVQRNSLRKGSSQEIQGEESRKTKSGWERIRNLITHQFSAYANTGSLKSGLRKQNEHFLDGYLDQVNEMPDYVHIVGWILLKDGAADLVEVQSISGDRIKAQVNSRIDLETSFSRLPSASRGGFEVRLNRKQINTEFGYQFDLVTFRGKDEVCRIQISRSLTLQEDKLDKSGPFWLGVSNHLILE